MEREIHIQGYYSVEQAARELGCSTHEAWRLASDGTIRAARLDGSRWFLDALDVQRRRTLVPRKGRPLSCRMAFALLWRLSGLGVDWLDGRSQRRLDALAQRLAGVHDVLGLVRKRARLYSFELYPSLRGRMEELLVMSGAGEATAESMGVCGSTALEGYVTEERFASCVAPLQLPERANGGLRIRVSDWIPLVPPSQMPVAVVAVDLAEAADARSSAAGLDKLEELLHER